MLLKQPAVPLDGFGGTTSELAPAVWQAAQMPTFPVSVVVWVGVPGTVEVHGLAGWGDETVSP